MIGFIHIALLDGGRAYHENCHTFFPSEAVMKFAMPMSAPTRGALLAMFRKIELMS